MKELDKESVEKKSRQSSKKKLTLNLGKSPRKSERLKEKVARGRNRESDKKEERKLSKSK